MCALSPKKKLSKCRFFAYLEDPGLKIPNHSCCLDKHNYTWLPGLLGYKLLFTQKLSQGYGLNKFPSSTTPNRWTNLFSTSILGEYAVGIVPFRGSGIPASKRLQHLRQYGNLSWRQKVSGLWMMRKAWKWKSTHTIHVWYIYLHLFDLFTVDDGKCR